MKRIFIVIISLLPFHASCQVGEIQELDTCMEMDDLMKYAESFSDLSDTQKVHDLMCNCLYVAQYEGAVLKKGILKDCKEEGEWIEYGDSSRVMMITHYKEGKRDGEFLSYHRNGKIWLRSNYKAGNYDGLHQSYDPDGNLLEEIVYENSRVVSKNIIKDRKSNGVTEYRWPELSVVDKPGVYLWHDGELIFLRDFEENELINRGSPNFELTEEAKKKFYLERK